MASELERLVVRLELNATKYRVPLEAAVRQTQQAAKQIETVLTAMENRSVASLRRVATTARDNMRNVGASVREVRAPVKELAGDLGRLGNSIKTNDRAQQAANRSTRRMTDEARAAKAAERERNALMREGSYTIRSVETRTEQYSRRVADLRKQLVSGAIGPETFARALAKLRAEASRTQERLAMLANTVRNVSAGMRRAGAMLTVGVSVPLLATSGLFVKWASDAEEVRSKFDTAFNAVGNDAQRMAQLLDDSYGLSATGARELLANTGDLLTGFGLSQQSALSFAGSLNKLAVDLASFQNRSTEDVAHALNAALTGEREMLKTLGIVIHEQDVKARVALNAANGFTAATEREAAAMATLQLMMEQSRNAIGDYARTQQSFANQWREFKADIRDVGEAFGQILMPYAKQALAVVRAGVNWFRDLSAEGKSVIVAVAGIAAAAGPLLLAFGTLGGLAAGVVSGISAIVTVATTIGAPVLAIAAGVVAWGTALAGVTAYLVGADGLAAAWRYVTGAASESVSKAVGFVANFRQNIATLSTWFRTNWQALLGDAFRAWVHAHTNMIANVGIAIKTSMRLWTAFNGWLSTVIPALFKRIFSRDTLAAITAGMAKAYQAVNGFVSRSNQLMGAFALATLKTFATMAPELGRMLMAGITGQPIEAARIGANIVKAIGDEFSRSTGGIGNEFSRFLDTLNSDFERGAQNLNFAATARDIIREGVAEMRGPLAGFQSSIAGPQLNFSRSTAAAQQAAQQINGTLGGIRPPGIPGPSADALKQQKQEMERGQQLVEQYRSPIEKLRDTQAELNNLFRAGAIDAKTYQRALADANNTYRDSVTDSKAAKQATEQRNKLFEQGAGLMEQFRSPAEQLRATQADLTRLFNVGAIDLRTFDRAMAEATSTFQQSQRTMSGSGSDAYQVGTAAFYRQVQEFKQAAAARNQATAISMASRRGLNPIANAQGRAAYARQQIPTVPAGPRMAAPQPAPTYTATPSVPQSRSGGTDPQLAEIITILSDMREDNRSRKSVRIIEPAGLGRA